MKKILFAAALAIFALIISSACENPPIFAAIEQEVKLKPASAKGNIRGMIRIGDTLYVANGKIYYKPVGDRGKWSEMSGCPSGFCAMIATDGSNLYASFGRDSSFKAYKYASSTWMDLPGAAASAQYVVGADTIFAINAGTIYPITGGTVGSSWSHSGAPKGAAYTYCLFGDGLYGNTGTRISGSPTSGLKGICKGPVPNSVFVFDDSTLYCYNGTNWTNIAHGVKYPQSVTYLPNKQLVLISGIKGYGEIKLAGSNATLSGAQSVQAGSSDSSIPSKNYYQYANSVGKYTINPINAFDYGTNGYIIYVGVNDPNAKYTGLWGFYDPDQIEWNRE